MNNFYKGKLNTFKGNKRETYRVFNELLGKDSEKHLPAHDDEVKLSQEFEKYFTDKIYNITSEMIYNQAFLVLAESLLLWKLILVT